MTSTKQGKYDVYRLTVAEAMAVFRAGCAADAGYSARPIAFYFADQLTRPGLASPPSSDARAGAQLNLANGSDARTGSDPDNGSDARAGAQLNPDNGSDARTGGQSDSAQGSDARAGEQLNLANGSDARTGLDPDNGSDARAGEQLNLDNGSVARKNSESPTEEAGRGVPRPPDDRAWIVCRSSTPQGHSESPTEEAGRGGEMMLVQVMEISDPERRQRMLRERALDIGNRKIGTWMDLIPMLRCEFPEVRRLTASAMKKILQSDSSVSRHFFRPLVDALVKECYPQAQQYQLSALKRAAKSADAEGIAYLKDVARDPTLPESFRTAASEIVYAFETHHKLKESVFRHWCHRCKRPISSEESAAGIAKYGKPYCKRCFDERLLEDVNFENNVEAAKTRRTVDGVAVQSRGEKRIADWLAAHGIRYEYDERFRIVGDTAIRPDFYLREFDLYIEYCGMNTEAYNANRRKKLELYQREGRKLISLGFEDDRHLEERLRERLSLHIPSLSSPGGPR